MLPKEEIFDALIPSVCKSPMSDYVLCRAASLVSQYGSIDASSLDDEDWVDCFVANDRIQISFSPSHRRLDVVLLMEDNYQFVLSWDEHLGIFHFLPGEWCYQLLDPTNDPQEELRPNAIADYSWWYPDDSHENEQAAHKRLYQDLGLDEAMIYKEI